MNSHNRSLLSFDMLHSDVWTSPVLSSIRRKYYVLFFDNYSNFLWTFPMSQVYPLFQKLRAYINAQFQRYIKTINPKDPSYSHLRVFGCLCFPLFPSFKIHKLQPRSTKCVLDLSSNKIIICCHVMFDETIFPYAKLHLPQPNTYTFLENDLCPYTIQHLMDQNQTDPSNPQPANNTNHNISPSPNLNTNTPYISSPSHQLDSNINPNLTSLTSPSSPTPSNHHDQIPQNLPLIF